MTGTGALEAAILGEVTPTADEERALQEVARDLEKQATARLGALGLAGRAAVQGSVAKGTWLRGGADLDLFLLLDPSVDPSQLESVAKRVGSAVLKDARTKYAQHPYLLGTFRGHDVDLVPAFQVAEAGAKMSAVDRTPFHTEWVRRHLTPAQRGEVRLLKRWMKGTQTYGAQTATGGFSGYLVEVLVAHFRSFHGVLQWLAKDAQPRRIAMVPDHVKDDVSVLVVVDPVDPARNCSAAVNADTLRDATRAARAYLLRQDRKFFFPAAPRAEAAATLQHALAAAKAQWAGLLVRPATDRLDIVFPQFQRGGRSLEAGLADAGFTSLRHQVQASEDGSEVLLQWVTTGGPLAPTRIHRGPLASIAPNAERFRGKWEGHADRAGPIREGRDGRLEVEVRVHERDPAAWLRASIKTATLGKHMMEALPAAQVFDDPAHVPEGWGPLVADVVLDRRPWER